VSIHQARTALKLRKATEYPTDAKGDSDLRDAQQPAAKRTGIAGKKKPGNPHLRGPSGFLEQLENQLNSLLLQASDGRLCLDNMMPAFKDQLDPCTYRVSP
jgi:hypothetical protein